MINIGRIKSTAVKTLANDLIIENSDKFGEDFEKNKKAWAIIKAVFSKKMKNVVIGYITRRMKQIKRSGL